MKYIFFFPFLFFCTQITNGFALVRPPGHHAMQSEFCGYCVFNNAAIAASHALNHGVKRWVWLYQCEYVCVCICACVRASVCGMYVWRHANVCMQAFLWRHACVCVCVHACVHACVCVCVCVCVACVCMCVCVWRHAPLCAGMNVYVHMCVCVCVCVCVCAANITSASANFACPESMTKLVAMILSVLNKFCRYL